MQALMENLGEKGVKAELNQEAAVNCLGENVQEPVIRLKEQNLDAIRLTGIDSDSCGIPGEILRFQYQVQLTKKLSAEEMQNINSATRTIKEGKILSYWGGKVTGIKWVGQKLADILNQDQAIKDHLMKCIKSWSYLEFQIEAISPTSVSILGPRFSNPGAIADLYHSENKEEIQCCAFGYDLIESLARHIKAGIV